MPGRSRDGFTMVEIVAVLVIIAILAAIAAPRFVGMSQDARDKSAMAGVSEAKATLSIAYVQAYVDNDGVQPTIAAVMAVAGFTSGTPVGFGDVNVTPTVAGNTVNIVANSVRGTAVSAGVADTWNLPTQ